MLIYNPKPGRRIGGAIRDAIVLAKKHNRKVRLTFNGITLQVNKRLSVEHVFTTWDRMSLARRTRFLNSVEARSNTAERVTEIAKKQTLLDTLEQMRPKNKIYAMMWLSHWLPLADDIGVRKDKEGVIDLLEKLGFIEEDHVGACNKDSSVQVRAEYVAGQVISLLRHTGAVHPHVAGWATDIAREVSVTYDDPYAVGAEA